PAAAPGHDSRPAQPRLDGGPVDDSRTDDTAAADATRGLRAAHHSAGAVHGREQRLLVLGGVGTLEDDRLVAHRAADEALLPGPGRCAALPDHPVPAAEVLLEPGKVVVVVHLVHRLGTEDLEHLGDHDVTTR